jgi:hypothetical protein
MALTTPKMGLRVWDQLNDPYDHNQLADNWSKVDFHDHSPGRGVPIPTEGISDGAITAAKLSTNVFGPSSVPTSALSDAARLGLTDGATIRRGSCIVPGTDPRTNVAYGLMTTPDRVSNVVLPTNGLIVVAYQATWQESVAGAGRAAIFLGTNQQQCAAVGGPVTIAAATGSATATHDLPLFTMPTGLASSANQGSYTGDVTTGQALAFARGGSAYPNTQEISGAVTSEAALSVGGPTLIFAAAGTYDVSVQFKATSGTVTAKNRKLWVWTVGF